MIHQALEECLFVCLSVLYYIILYYIICFAPTIKIVLVYKLSEFHLFISTKLHIFAHFVPSNKPEVIFSSSSMTCTFLLYHTIWAINKYYYLTIIWHVRLYRFNSNALFPTLPSVPLPLTFSYSLAFCSILTTSHYWFRRIFMRHREQHLTPHVQQADILIHQSILSHERISVKIHGVSKAPIIFPSLFPF